MFGPQDVKFFMMVVLVMFAGFAAGVGLWLTRKGVEKKDEDFACSALCAFIVSGVLLYQAAKVGGVLGQ